MGLSSLLLVLAAAALHATWNLVLHETRDRLAAFAVAGLVGGGALLPVAFIASPLHVWPLIVLSALGEVAYALCLSAAYQRGTLSLTYPIGRGTAPLLVTLGGWLLLTQRPSPETLGGACALVLGLTLIGTTANGRVQAVAIGFALLTGICIAGYSIIDARAVHQVSPVSYLGAVELLQGLIMALGIRYMSGSWERLRTSLRPGAAIAVGSISAYLLVLMAFQRTGAGQVATLREVAVLVGLLLAREKAGWRTWVGATLVVVGAVLAAL
jgi:drug/metabolite transporter (DMT)-like permease